MNTSVRIVYSCASMVILCSGCLFNSREVTVSDIDSLDGQREYYRNELISHDGMMLESQNFLSGNLLTADLRSNPVKVLRKLEEFFKVSGNPKYLLIAADICRYLATQVSEDDAIEYNLSSYYFATTYFRTYWARNRRTGLGSDSPAATDYSYDLTASQGIQSYNESCAGIFSYLHKRKILDATAITLKDKEGRKYVLEKPRVRLSLPQESIMDFSLCSAYEVKNLMQMNREVGIGVPLVATVAERQWYSSLKTPPGLTIPVSFSISREDKDAGGSEAIPLRLNFVDTYRHEFFQDAAGDGTTVEIRMALDFSTPLACFLNNITGRNLLLGMLRPQSQQATEGLYMVEPYQPNKIPVVFIHGLMSSPETWVQMINSLKNDPTIRNRYQFWFFSYTTGAPVLVSAYKLRTALLAAQKEFCTTPEATENFNQMVLVGHSMGGLLTRLMVQKHPHQFFESLYKMSWDQVKAKLQPKDFEYLDSYVPYPLPFVHRAVFMAVPHKGADMAHSILGRLGSYLIELPKSLVGKESTIERINSTLIPDYAKIKAERGDRFYTGIDNLDPDNPFVRVNGKSELKDDLTYHCIIGNYKRAGAPDSSDGIVPYWSSHLDNAASEVIVKSDHSVHRRPAAIQELLRILLLHLKGAKSTATAVCPGK